MDGLLMGFLAREINAALVGGRVDRATQPDHDLVVLGIRNGGKNHRLLLCATPGYARLHLSEKTYENPAEAPMFCMLLRKHLSGGRFLLAEQLFGDRLLRLRFSAMNEMGDPQEKLLYFEAMGKHSNLSLVEDGVILDSLRHVTLQMSRVRQMLPGQPYLMPPGQDKLAPEEADEDTLRARMAQAGGPLSRFLSDNVAGLGAASAEEIAFRAAGGPDARLGDLNIAQTARKLAGFFQGLPDLCEPMLLTDAEGKPAAALPFPFLSLPGALQLPRASLSEAVETLYFERDLANRFSQRAAGLRKALKNAQERLERKLALLEEDILTREEAEELRKKGELLTASLHDVPRGAEEVTLPDYYTGGNTTVALDRALTPAQNAQRYFVRYRKAHTARKLAGEQRQKAQADLRALEEAQYFLDAAQSVKELAEIRAPLSEAGLLRREGGQKGKKKEAPSRPLAYRSPEGFLIRAGRSAAQNEQLLKSAMPDDLWLHAKDVPGSHVLVSAQGQRVPEATLLLAASLAAFHSGARGQTTRVDYTPRKNVHKTPGGAPGQVHYTGEKSLMAGMTAQEAGQVQKAEG